MTERNSDKHKIENGERVMVRFRDYEGLAGVQTRADGKKYVAFTPKRAKDGTQTGQGVLVDGRAHRTVKVERSTSVPGMLVVEVEDIEDVVVE